MSLVETDPPTHAALRRALPGAAAFVVVCAAAWALGGTASLRWVLWIAVAVAMSAAAAWLFRAALSLALPQDAARIMGSAPLTACFGILTVLLIGLVAILAPVLAPFGESQVAGPAYAPADATFWLGTDQLGRDMASRVIWGARNTVGIALVTTAIAFTIGALAGLIAAVLGGWVDMVLGRLADVLLAIPQLVFALLLLTVLGTSILSLVLVIGLLYAPLVFRLTRAVAGGIVVMDYVEAARLRGETTWWLVTREILPNATAPLIAEFGLRFCFVFLTIAGLSFLGVGIQPPTADWGSMVRETAMLISFGEVTPLIPAGAIALLTVSINFVVDWMLSLTAGLKD